MSKLKRLLASKDAATSVEYAMLCAFIVLAMMVGLQNMATEIIAKWDLVSSKSAEVMTGP
jgi:Flp pilus assembly pilin Flp